MKKIFLSLAIVSTMIFNFPAQVNAKIVTDKLPLLTYAETAVPVYDAPNGKKRGMIGIGNSLVLVKSIRADDWAYGSYKIPNSKKRVYRWFRMSELQGYSDFENYTDKATMDLDAYRTRTSGSFVGKVAGDEDLIVVAKRGDRIKIIFKADGDFYRMGWVLKNSLTKTASETLSGDTTLETISDTTLQTDLFTEDTGSEDFSSSDITADEDLSAYEE